MFTNASCTVWEKTEKNRSPTYIRHAYTAVYWEDTHGETVNGIARNPDDRAFVCIHESVLGYIPKPDDRILCGISESETPDQSSLTVTAVKNFLYGSPQVRHMEVYAK